jgi:hypothetical protein
MSTIRINRNPTARQLNQFGFVWLGFVAFFGAVAWFKFSAPTAAVGLWISSVGVPLIGWVFPSFMRLVFVGMSYAAWPIGFVVSHVVLAIVYFLVLTPIGLLLRAFRYDPMTRTDSTGNESRWVPRTAKRPPESYFQQF